MSCKASIYWGLTIACTAWMPSFAAAQSTLGSACATFPGVYVQQQTVTLTHAAAPGQLVAVSAVVDASAQLADTNPVVDSAGNSYLITSATALDAGSGILFTYAGRIVNALNGGSTVTISYFSTGSTLANSCAQVSAFPGVPFANPDDVYGSNDGTGSSWAVTSSTPTQFANELIYSVFAATGTPGAIMALAPAQALGGVCDAGGDLCLQPAWNLGAVSSGIYEGADADSANSANWGAQLISFRSNERIFANGFE